MDLVLPPPVEVTNPAFNSWINDNFRVIVEAFKLVPSVKTGTSLVTGAATITTSFKLIKRVIASFNDDPTTGRFTLAARPSPTPGAVLIRVFDNTGALSIIATNVSWIAEGV